MMQAVERMLPLHEGKMGWQYDHRYATFHGTGDADISPNLDHDDEARVMPRYWVREEVVADRLARRTWGTDSVLLGFRRVARNADERTAIASTIPFGAASYGWILSAGPEARDLALLIAQYNSFVFDYLLRQFLSQPSIPQGTFSQLPIVPRERFALLDPALGDAVDWLIHRVIALTGSGVEMREWVSELGSHHSVRRPWDVDVRERYRAELDAAMFHLFGIARNDVDYIMDTFPIVKRKDNAAFGSYRTKEAILDIYDAMQVAIDSGMPYESPLEKELAP